MVGASLAPAVAHCYNVNRSTLVSHVEVRVQSGAEHKERCIRSVSIHSDPRCFRRVHPDQRSIWYWPPNNSNKASSSA